MIDTYYSVTGMTCGCCASKVESAVKELPGVAKVIVDENQGQLVVTTETDPDGNAVITALSEAGYEAAQK